ncbi:MAG: helix-turn-helix transcriptional regulator [Gemmatimonadales bacterium]
MPLSTNPASFLPLHPLAFHVLLVLLDGPTHGYRIVKELESQPSISHPIMPANLYRRLRDLVDQQLLEELPAHDDPRGRRDFRITPLGRKVVASEARRLAADVAIARGKGLLRHA